MRAAVPWPDRATGSSPGPCRSWGPARERVMAGRPFGRRSRSALTRGHAGQVLMNFSAAAGRPGGPTTPSRGAQGGHRIQVAAHWQRRRRQVPGSSRVARTVRGPPTRLGENKRNRKRELSRPYFSKNVERSFRVTGSIISTGTTVLAAKVLRPPGLYTMRPARRARTVTVCR